MLRAAIVLALGLGMALAGPASGQSADSLRSLRARVLRPTDGVAAVHASADGFLYVGANSGLLRYDGLSFTPLDHHRDLRDRVRAIVPRRGGGLLVGAGQGARVHALPGEVTAPDGAAATEAVTALAEHGPGRWIGTTTGLWLALGQEVRRVAGVGPVHALVVDEHLWIAADEGVYRVDDQTPTAVLRAGPARTLAAAGNGAVWVGAGQQLWRCDAGGCTRDTAWPAREITALAVAEGWLWVGTSLGLLRKQGAEVVTVALPGADLQITCLAADRDGHLWAGTHLGGLIELTLRPTLEVRDPGAIAWAATPGREGDVWLVLNRELVRHHQGRFERHQIPPEGGGGLRAVAVDADGVVWAGGLGGALYRYDGALTRVTALDRLPRRQIRTLLASREGTLWIGFEDGGLAELRGDQLHLHAPADVGCPAPVVTSLQASDGALWFGSLGAGLCRRQAGRFAPPLRASADLPTDNVLSLHHDGEALWIGTRDAGLLRLSAGQVAQLGAGQGLPDDLVGQILDDGVGHLWLSGRAGIHRVPRADIAAVLAGRRSAVRPLRFGAAEGMRNTSLLWAFSPSGTRAADGALWFPTLRGLAVIPRPRAVTSTRVPKPVIDQALVDGVALPAGARVPVGRGSLEVRYAAAQLSAAHRLRFRYRLQGFDTDWVPAGERRTAYYTNLPPGRYQFHVQAGAEDTDSTATATLSLELAPPFHRTGTFFGLLAGVTLMLGLAGVRLRTQQRRARLKAVADERARIARDLHDSFEQGLVGIKLQLEAADASLATPDVAQSHLRRAVALLAESAREAKHVVRALRGSGAVADLPTAIAASAGEALRGAAVEFSLRTEGTPFRLQPEAEQQVSRVVGAAIANAVRHARPRRIVATLSYSQAGLSAAVRDDGEGLSPEAVARAAEDGHHGLQGMRERAEQLGGRLVVTGTPGAGTTVELFVPARWMRGGAT